MGTISPFYNYLVLFIFTLIAFVSKGSFAQNKIPVTSKTEYGLYTVTVDTSEGEIDIYLPDDMSAGDTISGIVVAEPYGKTSQERQRNTDELNGYVVELEVEDKEIGGTKISEKKLKKVSIPKKFRKDSTKITVYDSDGNEVITTEIEIEDSPHPLQYTEPPLPKDFKLPRIGKSGEPVQVLGPFDGAFDTSSVKIGRKEAQILAESPRKVIVKTPSDITGSTKIELLERGVSSSGEFYIADLTIHTTGNTVDGIWRKKSGKTSWIITHQGQSVTADSVFVPEQDQIRGYRPNVHILSGSFQGNLLVGKTQQFFLMPLEECMAMCPSKCEQWNDIELILSEDGNTLSGQIQEKAINTETCAVIEFGFIPWTMIRQ